MEYNHELESFYKSFGSTILYSLCNNPNHLFTFKKGKKSKLDKYIRTYEFSRVVQQICSSLTREGNYAIFLRIIEKDKGTSIVFSSNPISEGEKIEFIFPKSIISDRKRTKTIKSLKFLNFSRIYSDKENIDNLDNYKFITEMKERADIEIGKVGKQFYINQNSCSEYYTDYYCVYRKIRQMIAQRKLVDYVLKNINNKLVDFLKLDVDDIVLFDGIAVDKLEELLLDLKQHNKSLSVILDELNQKTR